MSGPGRQCRVNLRTKCSNELWSIEPLKLFSRQRQRKKKWFHIFEVVVSICYSRLGKKKKRKRKNLNKLGSNENIHKKIVYLKINVLHLQQLLKRRRRKKKEKKGGGELGGGGRCWRW